MKKWSKHQICGDVNSNNKIIIFFKNFLKLQDKDKKIVDLQHDLSELKHELLDKENECRDLEDKYSSKNTINQKVRF